MIESYLKNLDQDASILSCSYLIPIEMYFIPQYPCNTNPITTSKYV